MNSSSKRLTDMNSSPGVRRSKRHAQPHETLVQILIRILNEVIPDGGHGRRLTYFELISLKLWAATTSGKGTAAMKVWNKYQKLAPKLQTQKLSVKFADDPSEVVEGDR